MCSVQLFNGTVDWMICARIIKAGSGGTFALTASSVEDLGRGSGCYFGTYGCMICVGVNRNHPDVGYLQELNIHRYIYR